MENNTLDITGYLDFKAPDVSNKHVEQSTWKRFAMINLDCDICQYYSWYILKRYGLKLNKPLRGSHITIINDRIDQTLFDEFGTIFNGKSITCKLKLDQYRTNGEHWWINVECEEANNIREAMGIGKPYFGYHLTLGYAAHLNLLHSEYIHKCIKLLL